mmetsp:Transcript_2034/g.5873  ORF Transcript_2034/g.5873 Transcript_2034/m.5873 type:complete len:229 (-) Transcript_2034:1778-2464(-)
MQVEVEERAFACQARLPLPRVRVVDDQHQRLAAELLHHPLNDGLRGRVQRREGLVDQQHARTSLLEEDLADELGLDPLASRERTVPVLLLLVELLVREARRLAPTLGPPVEGELGGELGDPSLERGQLLGANRVDVPLLQHPRNRLGEQRAIKLLPDLDDVGAGHRQPPQSADLQALRQHRGVAAAAREQPEECRLAAAVGARHRIDTAGLQCQLRDFDLMGSPSDKF